MYLDADEPMAKENDTKRVDIESLAPAPKISQINRPTVAHPAERVSHL
jgi:hypothetical protein